jgi:hypothetical protein
MSNDRAFGELRQSIDSNDPFMTGGHQIMKARKRQQASAPAWAEDDAAVRDLLKRVFPKLLTDAKQRKRAARWAAVIQMYYRVGMSRDHIAVELKTTSNGIRSVLQRVRWAAEGKTTPHGGWSPSVRGIRPRGRPKKIAIPSAPPV